MAEDVKLTRAQVIAQGRKFMERYGLDTSDMSDADVMKMVTNIQEKMQVSAEVLHRGAALSSLDRLLSHVPEGYQGEFKRNNANSISRAKALGWEIFSHEDASEESPTGTGDTTVVLGDQILMIKPMEDYLASRAVKEAKLHKRRERRKLVNDPRNPTSAVNYPIFELED